MGQMLPLRRYNRKQFLMNPLSNPVRLSPVKAWTRLQ